MYRNYWLPVLSLLFISLCACSTPRNTADSSNTRPASLNLADMPTQILSEVNNYRKSKGLGSLKMLDAANEQAKQHSRNMAIKKTAFGHDGFEERIDKISKSAGRMMAAAENVAYGELTAKEVVKGWINSPGHRKNIEGNYTLTGIAVHANSKGVIYYTQLFMRQ